MQAFLIMYFMLNLKLKKPIAKFEVAILPSGLISEFISAQFNILNHQPVLIFFKT